MMQFYSIDVATGVPTAIGGLQTVDAVGSVRHRVVSGFDGVMYAATVAETNRMQLYSMDVATGIPSAIGGLQTVDLNPNSGIGLASF